MPVNEKISCLEQLVVKYKGRTKEKVSGETTTTLIYQGSRELCEEAMKELHINSTDKEYGNLESMRMTQDAGPFWNLELKYSIEYDTSTGSAYGPKQSTLTVRTISMPLESKKGYRRKWNMNLYCTKKSRLQP